MKTSFVSLVIILAGVSSVMAAGVRCQLEEVLFKIDAAGHSHPVDHQVIDVFRMEFENQYGAVEKESEHGKFGASYMEVPASAGQSVNHNVYAYVADGPCTAITDGYHNGAVPGSLFRMTLMTTRRIDDTVRVRTMHIFNPQVQPGRRAVVRELQAKVDAMLATARQERRGY